MKAVITIIMWPPTQKGKGQRGEYLQIPYHLLICLVSACTIDFLPSGCSSADRRILLFNTKKPFFSDPVEPGDYVETDQIDAGMSDPDYTEYGDFLREADANLEREENPRLEDKKTVEKKLQDLFGFQSRTTAFKGGRDKLDEEESFTPMHDNMYDAYVYGDEENLFPLEFNTSELGDYEYSDFSDYFLDAEANEDTMRMLKKVWQFNENHPHHPGYTINIKDNHAKKKPNPTRWTPEQLLQSDISKKKDFDEFWYLQDKYYKQPQFCDPEQPCTFRGQLSVGKSTASDSYEYDHFKDGRNVHMHISGILLFHFNV